MKKEFNLGEKEWIMEDNVCWRKEKDVKELIQLLRTEMPKKCIERGQFNEAYFEKWLKKRAGEDFI